MSPMLRTLWTFRSRQAAMSVAGILLVGILTLTACAAPSNGHTGTPTAAPNPISPAWAAVLKQIGSKGEVSLATAEQAYALVFGALPGVSAPANSGGVIPDGTLALRMILAHYNDLNAAQQQAVLQRFGYKAPTAKSAAVAPVAAIAGVTRAVQASVLINPTPVPTDVPVTTNYRTMINEFIPKMNAALHYTLTLPISLAIDVNAKKNGDEAYTACFNSNGLQTGTVAWCQISFDSSLSSETEDDQRLIVAHELFHCYQAALFGDLSMYYYIVPWIIEGSASWAAATISGVSSQSGWTQDNWGGWLTDPEKTLFSRAYDAIGFYALINQAGISPWSAIPAMLASQHLGPSNTAAYIAATQANPQRVLDLWASSYYRDTHLGADWDITGPAIPNSGYNGPTSGHSVSNGVTLATSTSAYTAQDLLLHASQADVLEFNITGTSRLHDGGKFDQAGTANGDYCTRADGNCTCPQGSIYTGPPLERLEADVLDLAITGGTQGASGAISGLSLDEFCNQKPKSATPALCQIVAPSEISQIVGRPVTKLVSSTAHTPLAQLTLCNYLPPSIPGYGGSIDFALSQDGASYYAIIQQEEQENLSGENAVSGVGDAAFWGTDPKTPGDLDFYFRKGNWVVSITIDGPGSDGSVYLAGAKQIAQEVLPHL